MKKRFLTYLLVLLVAVVSCDKVPQGGEGGEGGQTAKITVSGIVTDSGGDYLEGVVVSDGLNCTKTDASGKYSLPTDLSTAKFIYVSTPSAYRAAVKGGIPQFFQRLSDLTPVGGVYQQVNFTLYKISNPDEYTVIFTADPQPRSSGASYDNFAYHSLDCCKDMFKTLNEVSSAISGRAVYGICLGDLVHEDMSLYSSYYVPGLASLNYPTYSVIGNHDHNTKAKDDDEGAAYFEQYLGPRDYSFNLGGIHYIVVDDMMMKIRESDGTLRDYSTGLSDRTWTWLQNDLKQISTETTVMICAHSPMFKMASGSDRSSSSSVPHGADYRNLLSKFKKVYAWAGHTHSTFNFAGNYPSASPVIESHTLTRTTGELWTNEYLGANGTPRGFVIMDVKNGEISWKFHPIPYQSGKYLASKSPAYTYRDWKYVNGVAYIGDNVLDDSYQIHAYAPGTYGDKYVYANVFMWDEMWSAPTFNQGSADIPMTRVTSAAKDYMYDLGLAEIRTWYVNNNSTLGKTGSGYTDDDRTCPTMFRTYVTAASGTGTIKVKDRFGNTYTTTISW